MHKILEPGGDLVVLENWSEKAQMRFQPYIFNPTYLSEQ